MTEVRRCCLLGDQGSQGGLEGELRRLEKRVMSVGMAEMVLRSPTVSSLIVLSSRVSVKVKSSSSSLGTSSVRCCSCSGDATAAVSCVECVNDSWTLLFCTSCKESIALVSPSLNRTVGSAGEPGGESSLESSCKRYFIGENAFRGLVCGLGRSRGE